MGYLGLKSELDTNRNWDLIKRIAKKAKIHSVLTEQLKNIRHEFEIDEFELENEIHISKNSTRPLWKPPTT